MKDARFPINRTDDKYFKARKTTPAGRIHIDHSGMILPHHIIRRGIHKGVGHIAPSKVKYISRVPKPKKKKSVEKK